MKKVRLEPITPQNFKECINLKVADEQMEFVATNVASIAQSKIYPTANPMAVYDGGQMVGFVMFGYDEEDEHYCLARLMIDARFQKRGYGRAATLAVIETMREISDCREIYLSFVPENHAAAKLYESIGFEPTGELNEGEIVMRYVL